ncbi:MAG TPA: hypothetical protein VNR67_04280 [Solirubrobacterales bacterium]|nr:hypothetical protein [Solirubrobacterales bacterium]
MKARGGLAILVCALAALALPPPATASPSKGISLSSVKLEESNGYELEFTAVRFDKRRPVASVTARRGIASASYTVRPASGAGTHATFGTLGRVDLAFHRHKKVVDRPEKHCRWIFESGVFRGGFSFVGEGGYVADEAVDPEGTVLRLPNGFCGLGNFRPGLPPGLPRETVLAALARTDSGEVSFRASRLRTGNGPILFRASTRERVQGVDISRSVRTQGRKGDFTATGASRGAASPPPPFSGSARFRDPADGSATWTGTLAVALPGLEGVALAGEDFTARLCPRLSLLASCLPGPERARIGNRYGSGSHSQPLALARLSSLR